jgi:RHS repeat-associated protein
MITPIAPVHGKPPPAPPPAPPVFATTQNASANAVLGTLDKAISPFRDAPPAKNGKIGAVAQYVSGALGIVNAPAMFIDTAVSVGISKGLDALGLSGLFPGMPVANIGVTMHMGTPHTHLHPPSTTPPAPPIPLPSMGVAFLAGSASVLVNGMPVLRAGDIGIGFTCGSMAPPFEIVTGASGVYFAGARVARIGADITFHCNPAEPMGAFAFGMGIAGGVAGLAGAAGQLVAGNAAAAAAQAAQAALDAGVLAIRKLRGKDPAGPPGVGMLIGPPTNVLAGGPPIPNVGAWAQGKLFSAIGKALRSLKGKLSRESPAADANGQKCQGGEPVHVVTGENYNTHHDFASFHGGFRWLRHTTSARSAERGALGWGFRHVFETRLEVRLHRATFLGFRGERIQFPRLRTGENRIGVNGYVLTRLTDMRFRVYERRMGTLEFTRDNPSAIALRLASVESDVAHTTLVYDATRRLTQILETPRGGGPMARYALAYDDNGLLTEVRGAKGDDAEQRLVAYRYDAMGHLADAFDATGAGENFVYDLRHRLTEARDRNGYRFRWEYDMEGRCTLASGEDGLWFARFEYVPAQSLTRMTMHDGSVRSYHYDEDGIILKIVDPFGGVLVRERGEDGRICAEVDSGGRRMTFLYDENGAHVARVDRFGHRYPPEIDQPKVHDPFRRILPASTRDRALGATIETFGSVTFGSVPEELRGTAQFVLWPAAPPRPSEVAKDRDVYGHVVREVDADHRTREWQFDRAGNLVARRDRDGRLHRRQITSWNLVGAQIDPLGNATLFSYNPHERVTSVTDPLGARSVYDYDSKDRLIRVHRHDRVREEYVYDEGDRRIEKRSGDGTTLLKMTPHANGLPAKIELAVGASIELDYDARGKVTKASTALHDVAIAWDPIRRLLRDGCDDRQVVHRYGAGGLYCTVVADHFPIRYQRDRWGRLSIIAPNGATWALGTDKHGAVFISHASGTDEVQRYDESGRLRGRLAWHRAKDGRLATWTSRLEYTPEGDLLAVHDSQRGTRSFELDAAHRLIAEIDAAGVRHTYAHDEAGNLAIKPGLLLPKIGVGNRLLHAGLESFTYDARDHVIERRTSANVVRYARDSFDQLVSIDDGGVEPWTASYDGLGRRVSAGRGDRQTLFWWDNDRLAAETAPDGRLRIYVYADEVALVPLGFVEYDSVDAPAESGRAYVVFSDQVGMPLHIEDAEGRVVWRAARIDPYGVIEVEPGAELPYFLRWPGHYFDAETGLHYNRFRYYDPALGRYLESDPLGCAGGINLYAYPSNPLVSIDVLGLHNDQSEPPEEGGSGRPSGEEEPNPNRQSIEERMAQGGEPPDYVMENPSLYEFDTESGRYRRIDGEGHSRASEYPSGYRDGTHDAMAARFTEEGIAQEGVPVDAEGNRIPNEDLHWQDADGNPIPYHDEDGNTNLTYDHQTSSVEMWNDGATTTNPETGETTTYPPGRDSDRATRNDFYNDPNNLTPMSRSDNSSKGGGGQTYNENPTGPDYEP